MWLARDQCHTIEIQCAPQMQATWVILNFLLALLKNIKGKQMISILMYLAQHIHNIVILTYNQYKDLLMRDFTFFFILSPQNPFCTLPLKHISIWTSHISNTQHSLPS